MSKGKKITVALVQPIMIADKEFAEITIREPIANDLRGISITQLQMSEADATFKILERVTDIHVESLQRLSLSDFAALSNVILGFLFPQQMQSILEGIELAGNKLTIA